MLIFMIRLLSWEVSLKLTKINFCFVYFIHNKNTHLNGFISVLFGNSEGSDIFI